MEHQTVMVAFGGMLLVTGIIGGGFEIKEIRMPRVGTSVRLMAGVVGLGLIVASLPEAGPSPTFAHQYADVVPAADQRGEEDYEYDEIVDDTGSLVVSVPTAWGDVDGRPYDSAGLEILDVRAAPDLGDFAASWDVPGVILSASFDTSADARQRFAGRRQNMLHVCTGQALDQDYDDGVYTGVYDVYSGCGQRGAGYIVVTAMPEDAAFVIGVEIQIVDTRDLEALDHVIRSFELVDAGVASRL